MEVTTYEPDLARQNKLIDALGQMSTAHIVIPSYSPGHKDRDLWFKDATLWRVIQNVVRELYFDELREGKISFIGPDGKRYGLKKKGEGE